MQNYRAAQPPARPARSTLRKTSAACAHTSFNGLTAMYEYISGRVAEVAPTYAVIDAGGVGYCLNISLETFSAIEHAAEAKLYVHFVVREDAQLLYGFATKIERELFRLLLSVSGVGGNTARMILVELSGKLTTLAVQTDIAGMPAAPSAETADEALAALVMLGFARTAAEKVLRTVLREAPGASVEEIVRMALKRL